MLFLQTQSDKRTFVSTVRSIRTCNVLALFFCIELSLHPGPGVWKRGTQINKMFKCSPQLVHISFLFFTNTFSLLKWPRKYSLVCIEIERGYLSNMNIDNLPRPTLSLSLNSRSTTVPIPLFPSMLESKVMFSMSLPREMCTVLATVIVSLPERTLVR
jgi:hypothetical protein